LFRPGAGRQGQDRRRFDAQHPAQRAERAAHRGRRGGEQRRHFGFREQELQLRAIAAASGSSFTSQAKFWGSLFGPRGFRFSRRRGVSGGRLGT
jgi:hypothetical protein